MTDAVRVLYVADSDATGERLESLFEDDRPAVELSSVASLGQALATLGEEEIDYIVLDATVAEGANGDLESMLRREQSGVRVDVVPGVATETEVDATVEVTGDQLRRAETEQVRALARRIENAVTSESAEDGGVGGEHFRALAEELSDVVLVIDTDSTIRFANAAVDDIFGYAPEELVGESLTELMPERFAERYIEGLQRYLDEGERRLDWDYLELSGERRDGTEIPLGISFSEFTSGDSVLFTGIVRDISGRKRQESELRNRIRQQEALSKFSRHALEDLSVPDLMDEATELVADALDNEYAGVLEYRPDEDDLLARTGLGWGDDVWNTATIGTDRDSQGGYTLLTEKPVVVEDFETEDRFADDQLLASVDVSSGISVVIGSPDEPWGVLGAHDTKPKSYSDHDVQFVQNIARILTTAIQRSERERRLERYEAMLNAVDDGVYALDADSRFVAVNDAYVELTGYDREELLGEHVSKVLRKHISEKLEWVREALENGEEAVTMETEIPTADGRHVPVEARITLLPLGSEAGRVGVVRDVSDRKRREEKLTSLNELFESLTEAETPTEICELAVDAADETLGFPNAAVALYDDEKGALVSTVRRWSGGAIDDALLGSGTDDVAWRTFVEGESKTFDNLAAELGKSIAKGSALAIPLGKYGVFLAAAPETHHFDPTDASLADMLCSNVRSALDRAEREETLRDQRNDLQEKNRELERVNRINHVIREITKALTQASSQDDVMQAVCDRLTQTGPYRFAWFGKHDRASGEVQPQAWAGVEEGYLEDTIMTAEEGDAHGEGPAGRAVRTQELQVQNDLLGDPPFDPWREQALKRGYRSCVSVPVVYGGALRGVLILYASETDVFNEMEQAVLTELGETIGYALNSLEQRQALVSERSIELDFRVRGVDSPLLAFVTQTDAEFEFENAVEREDGRLHAFFTIRDLPPDRTIGYVEDVSWIESVRLITERDGEYLYECTLAHDSFLGSLVDRGAIPQSITATKDETRFVIRLPQSADVRAFVDRFEEYYDDVELVARRERDEPVMTRQEFESELTERLTDRQREVLRTAYLSGFFEWPRESTAEDIAEVLDVSQPTVSRHLRAAERALFGLLFEDD
ncbi:PAS domain S-box protein [Halorussus lipolyticus]|uniref:PAS domain S-box protein n=1 Tax=Halorussus lipolyticus TaxID=3034024 RepID=UPI0023E80678|nr:PAS domain S-box protein [Halorussus sp. DT80]